MGRALDSARCRARVACEPRRAGIASPIHGRNAEFARRGRRVAAFARADGSVGRMLFCSYPFLVFLAVVLLVTRATERVPRAQKLWLLLASNFFYGY